MASSSSSSAAASSAGWHCNSCTFLNHPALLECEICSDLRVMLPPPSSSSSSESFYGRQQQQSHHSRVDDRPKGGSIASSQGKHRSEMSKNDDDFTSALKALDAASANTNNSGDFLGRTDSLELSEQFSIPRNICRQVLEYSGGDLYVAFCNLIRIMANPSPKGSDSKSSDFKAVADSNSLCDDLSTLRGELKSDTMFGVSREHIMQMVRSAGGDIELAQRQLFFEFQAHRKSEALASSVSDGSRSPRHPSKDLANCPICFEPCKAKRAMTLSCSHSFCIDCLRMHASESVKAGNINIICPSGNICKVEMSQFEVQTLLDHDNFKILDRRALEQAVAIDTSMHLCATPDCPYVVAWSGPEDGPSLFDCPMCLHKRCIVCGLEPFHIGKLCPPPIVAAPKSSENNLDDRLLLSMNIKRCKRCGQGVVKELGCDKVKCRCGYRFCYICLSENAQCPCTPASHGFIDNLTGRGDFSGLRNQQSPS